MTSLHEKLGRLRDRRLWGEAESLADLGDLTARWLQGGLRYHPGYTAHRPDEETRHLVPALAGLNRAGYVTICSQPGEEGPSYDGGWYWQRASVEGLTDVTTAVRLYVAATEAGLLTRLHDGPRRRFRRRCYCGIEVTIAGEVGDTPAEASRVCTDFGARLSKADLSVSFTACGRAAYAEVLTAWQVTVVDPVWGRDDVLWPVLLDAVGSDDVRG